MRIDRIVAAGVVGACCLLSRSAYPAAEINVKGNIVSIAGTIDGDDFEVFKSKVEHINHGLTVVLHSLGGSLRASLDIGRFISDKKWNTSTETICWSGCAYIWLAGAQRFKTANARMGVRGVTGTPGLGYFHVRPFLLGLGYSSEMAEAVSSLRSADFITLNNDTAKRFGITFTTTQPTLPANAFASVDLNKRPKRRTDPGLVNGLKEMFEDLRRFSGAH